jgi:hypothetical protein
MKLTPRNVLIVSALFVSSMAAFWASVGTIWSLLLRQMDGVVDCGLTAMIAGVVVRIVMQKELDY